MCVKAMTNIIPISISPGQGKTLLSLVCQYLQQESSWILSARSMWVFMMSSNFPENLAYIPSINSTCTPNTLSLSDNGVIASNHVSREDIISIKTQH